jgi:hypothetical protein
VAAGAPSPPVHSFVIRWPNGTAGIKIDRGS